MPTAADTLAAIPIIDTDSHICEPPDLWTSRLSSARWGDDIPRVAFDERLGRDRWIIGGTKLSSVANYAIAGWREHPPSHPPSMEEADPGAFEAKARLARMDEYGIYAQTLYPNLLAFSHHAFRKMERELQLQCIQAYNDFLSEFAEAAPNRFVLLTALPFWDVEASVKEIQRCHEAGHHGVLFIAKPHKLDLPRLKDDHWEPIFKTVEEIGSSINFHAGFAELTEADFKELFGHLNDRADYAKMSALAMLANGEAIADITMSGVCHRYPGLRFVSVESGFGWIPSFVEALDWQWENSGAALSYPDHERPSFYFKRQVMTMFWFEHEVVRRLIDLYSDNVMFETDYPHPTSLSPGPNSSARYPKDVARDVFRDLPLETAQKVLYENAARLYRLDEFARS